MAPCFKTTAYLLDSSRPAGKLIILDPDLRAHLGFWGDDGLSRDQGGDEGSEKSFSASAGVVDELEEAETEGQLLLRDAAARA
jgi:hypothetical protein